MQRSRSIEIAGEIGIGFSKVRFSNSIRVLPGPYRNVRSCSGHSPPLSQTGQSSGWLTRMNSRVAFCASAATAEVRAVRTTMPSCAVSVQAACGYGGPQPRLITKNGNLDPGGERSLDEPRPLRHLDDDAVDRERDGLGRAHAA